MINQWLAGSNAKSGDNIKHTRRQIRLQQNVHQFQHRTACLLRRLDHHRVARGKTGSEFPDEGAQGGIPRQNLCHDTEWLEGKKVVHIWHFGWNHPTFKLVTHPGVIVKTIDLPGPCLKRRCGAGHPAVITNIDLTQALGMT